MRELLGIEDGYLYYAWVVPAAIILCLLGVWYLPFLRALPRATRRRFIGAGLLYVGGALGVELLGGRWITEHGRTLTFFLVVTLEEVLELTGGLTFFDALVRHLGTRRATLAVRFGPAPGLVRLDAAGTGGAGMPSDPKPLGRGRVPAASPVCEGY